MQGVAFLGLLSFIVKKLMAINLLFNLLKKNDDENFKINSQPYTNFARLIAYLNGVFKKTG
jgi:hypothetical protein